MLYCNQKMGLLFSNFKYGLVLQAIAIIHFIRRRPDFFWLWIIFFGGGIGAMIYIAVEVVPDVSILRQYIRIASHRKRIKELEMLILDNPSAGIFGGIGGLVSGEEEILHGKTVLRSRHLITDGFSRSLLSPGAMRA